MEEEITTTESLQTQPKTANRNSVPKIREIEAEIDHLKPLINTAVNEKDGKQLRVYKTTTEVLAGDLEIIIVKKGTPLEQRKASLMKKLTHLYQKMNKILEEMKREDNKQYFSLQSGKEKAFNDLADIELRMAENESLLDTMDKKENVLNMSTVRNNVIQISQKLAKVDMVDSDVKEKVIIFSQKLIAMVKNLSQMLARGKFDSKFANFLETYDSIVKNFSTATNAEATKNNLKHLRNSVENLEEVHRSSVPTIRKIEAKVDDLKPLINTAADDRNGKQLRVYKTTIEFLAGDLEIIVVEKGSLLEKRKASLMKKLIRLYQKLNKVLEEIKREDNMQYLSLQNRRDKAFNDLADLEFRMAENESLLDKMDKEENILNVTIVRNNVIQISQQLSKVDIEDNDVKEKVVILSQKLTEMMKNLDQILARIEFDSKFAKFLETYENILKNFNTATNAEATKNNLEYLWNSLENLEEVNRSNVPTIREIEAKVDGLKPLINTAADEKDGNRLRVYKTTIEVLAGDLEIIIVEKGTPLEQRKASLMKKLTHLYQKMNKVLKEMKREDNMQYLSSQSRKEKTFNDLADVELRMAENESLLDKMNKEENILNVTTVRNNIIQISQLLAKVDIEHNEVKEKVVILSQKLIEMVKDLDQMLARREFDSKFAKFLETYESILKNFNAATNTEATKNNLEHLFSSVEDLDEVNDTTKNRKRELLANINKQINNLGEATENETDGKIIQKIVQYNLIPKKNVKSNEEYTVIDQFINWWNNVKSSFDVNAYSNLSLLRIDSTLGEMQQSISEIRIDIANKCDTNPPTNLIKKRFQSIAKLNIRKT